MESPSNFKNSPEGEGALNSHHIFKYGFSQENLDDIPHPDECSFQENKPITMLLGPDDLELPPLPPEYRSDKPQSAPEHQSMNISQPHESEYHLFPAQIPLPEDHSSQFTVPLPRSDNNTPHDDLFDIKSKFDQEFENNETTMGDSAKYSPSKIDSDEENSDFTMVKPKVLGKEQAKKRLLAFSLSKQPTPTIKKQNKVAQIPKNIKEKPPNPNKSTGVQDQFRATISEIEEEKRKMMQNMPNYLLSEMSDLAKATHPIMTSSLKLLEKHKATDSNLKSSTKQEDESLNKSEESNNPQNIQSEVKDNRKSKSPSRSYRRSRSRSRDGKYNRRNRDSSKSRKRRSRSKSQTKKSRVRYGKRDKRDTHYSMCENWKAFKASFTSGSDAWNTGSYEEDMKKDRENRRSVTPSDDRRCFKPTFNYLKKEQKFLKQFKARSADSRSNIPALFLEKKIKYTKTKPMLIWSENPSVATDFCMSRQMLMDNCDSVTTEIVNSIINSKGNSVLGDFDADGLSKIRKWYSFDQFLRPQVSNLYDEFEMDGPQNFESRDQIKETTLKTVLDEKNDKFDLIHKYSHNEKESAIKKENDVIEKTNSWDNGKNVNERRVNLVNDTYLSDNENASRKLKEVVVGDVKVQMNFDMNCVKVRSRWDSDYECENSENEETERTKTNVTSSELEAKVHSIYENKDSNTTKVNYQNLNYYQQNDDKNLGVRDNRNEPVAENDQAGNLASEYEEFLKMVSFEYDSSQTVEMKEKISDDSLKLEKCPSSTSDHSTNKFQKENLQMTDWDKDSDHESKLVNKINSRKSGYEKEFLLLEQDKLDQKPKKEKKVTPLKKKSDKLDRREKTAKKSTKGKKKKQGSSSSSDSSSDSYDSCSESDSDSDNNMSSRKKRKKMKKTKKKHKKSSSSSASDSESESDKSDSDSDVSRQKKKITKKKKDKKKKKDSSSESDEGRQTVLLKQLDFKKQLIMKKIEEIDTISEKNGKKKVKENKQKKKGKENSRDEESLEKYLKFVKKKKSEDSKSGTTKKKGKQILKSGKGNKETKKRTGSSDDSSDEEASKIKSKKKVEKIEIKKKRDVSKSSNSDFESDSEKEDKAASNRCSKSVLKKDDILNKNNKIKRKSYSSSDSDSDDSSLREKNMSEKKVRNKKEDKNTNCSWKDDFVMEDDITDKCTRSNLREENLEWKEMGKKPSEKVTKRSKDDDDWEASSSSEESAPDSKSRESWEEEAPCDNKKINKTDILEENFEKKLEMESLNRKLVSELGENTLPLSGNVKTSFPHFSLIDKNFGNLGQDFSSDFRLSDSNCSKSETAHAGESIANRDIDSQSSSTISKINYQTNAIKSELYSPGHSDSDVSESEERNESNKPNITSNDSKGEKYDPLNSESETSVEDGEDLNNIPLPCISDITLTPGKAKILDLETTTNEKALSISEMSLLSKSIDVEDSQGINFTLSVTNHASSKFKFKPADFSPSEMSPSTPRDTDKYTIKKQIINVKSQPKLKSKAASVFQEDSDESPSDVSEKTKEYPHSETDDVEQVKKIDEESPVRNKHKKDDVEKWESSEIKVKEEARKERNKRERSKERNESRSSKKRRSSSREKKTSRKSSRDRVSSPSRRKRSKTPEVTYKAPNKESKREIRSDSFEIEPLKSAAEYEDLEDTVQPIPVLTGLGMSSSEHRTWTMFPGYTCTGLTDATGELIDPSESFDIYPEDSAYRNQNDEKTSGELFDDKPAPKEKKERRRSRSRSSSLRKRRRSKSPEKRKSPRSRSPRRRSRSPKRRGRSPYSPRRKSPKRKSPNRRYRSSRSPDRRRKSRSRSPRKRRSSPARRSRSFSPRSHRRDSPRRRGSPTRGYSPRGSVSPRRDDHFSGHYSNNFHNRIPVIGVGNESLDRELSPSNAAASPIGFLHHSSTLNESGMNNSFFNRDYTGEFGAMNYPEELSVNNLITVKNHDSERGNSPERLSLDQRIELELGVPMNNSGSGDQYQKGQYEHSYQNSYNCENGNSGSEFYSNHSVPINSDYNSSYYNGHPPSQAGYGQFQQYPNSQNSMLQVGNIVEVVPTMQHSHSSPATPVKSSNNQIMQVGNVLQVVPSQKSSQDSPLPFHGQNFGPSGASLLPPVKTQKATAVVAPSSIVPQPNPEAMINPLIKAIQMEREKRKMEKKKRKEEREARRKARQLRREAKLMSVNEKLKKSVQDEGLMLGQEVEDDELLDGMDLPSPPIPVEIITVSSASALPPAGKGILITAGFMPKPPSEKKEVKFADGVLPGEGTSSSGEEDIASPPPKPKLPKEKRYKKKKTKVKKKVKVQIIKEIIQDDDDEEDDLSPPPPPPGDPPPIYFARFPFAGDAQFPVYQMQTTTTTLTTVQYPAPRF